MSGLAIDVASLWDGTALDAAEWRRLSLKLAGSELVLEVRAPFFGDPLPACPPGTVPELWNFEVVELFLLGRDERYLEVELGPGGHHLVLELHGRRRVVRRGLPLQYEAHITGNEWRGQARIPEALWPAHWHALNAAAISGPAERRRYAMWQPCLGSTPDFHRLDVFAPFDVARLR